MCPEVSQHLTSNWGLWSVDFKGGGGRGKGGREWWFWAYLAEIFSFQKRLGKNAFFFEKHLFSSKKKTSWTFQNGKMHRTLGEYAHYWPSLTLIRNTNFVQYPNPILVPSRWLGRCLSLPWWPDLKWKQQKHLENYCFQFGLFSQREIIFIRTIQWTVMIELRTSLIGPRHASHSSQRLIVCVIFHQWDLRETPEALAQVYLVPKSRRVLDPRKSESVRLTGAGRIRTTPTIWHLIGPRCSNVVHSIYRIIDLSDLPRPKQKGFPQISQFSRTFEFSHDF